jgi:hypothetical protein
MRLVVDHHLAAAVALDAQEPRREGAQQPPNPTSAEEVKIVLARVSRTPGTAPKRKAAATVDVIMAMLKCIPADTLLACGELERRSSYRA